MNSEQKKGDWAMHYGVNVRIYVPKLLDKLGVIILLWMRKKKYGFVQFEQLRIKQGAKI